jgi:hypothetical protein
MTDRPLTTDLAGRPIPGQPEVVYVDFEALRAKHRARQAELFDRGLPALERLVEVAEKHSGQSHHCRRLLLAVYNGPEWPLELTRLRCLDEDLQVDALTVIEWSAYTDRELHEYLDDGNDQMRRFWKREKQEG